LIYVSPIELIIISAHSTPQLLCMNLHVTGAERTRPMMQIMPNYANKGTAAKRIDDRELF